MESELLSDKFWKDDSWAHKHYQELIKKYPNKWVAIFNKKVISFGNDIKQVERKAEGITKDKEFPLLFIEKGAHVYKN